MVNSPDWDARAHPAFPGGTVSELGARGAPLDQMTRGGLRAGSTDKPARASAQARGAMRGPMEGMGARTAWTCKTAPEPQIAVLVHVAIVVPQGADTGACRVGAWLSIMLACAVSHETAAAAWTTGAPAKASASSTARSSLRRTTMYRHLGCRSRSRKAMPFPDCANGMIGADERTPSARHATSAHAAANSLAAVIGSIGDLLERLT